MIYCNYLFLDILSLNITITPPASCEKIPYTAPPYLPRMGRARYVKSAVWKNYGI